MSKLTTKILPRGFLTYREAIEKIGRRMYPEWDDQRASDLIAVFKSRERKFVSYRVKHNTIRKIPSSIPPDALLKFKPGKRMIRESRDEIEYLVRSGKVKGVVMYRNHERILDQTSAFLLTSHSRPLLATGQLSDVQGVGRVLINQKSLEEALRTLGQPDVDRIAWDDEIAQIGNRFRTDLEQLIKDTPGVLPHWRKNDSRMIARAVLVEGLNVDGTNGLQSKNRVIIGSSKIDLFLSDVLPGGTYSGGRGAKQGQRIEVGLAFLKRWNMKSTYGGSAGRVG